MKIKELHDPRMQFYVSTSITFSCLSSRTSIFLFYDIIVELLQLFQKNLEPERREI